MARGHYNPAARALDAVIAILAPTLAVKRIAARNRLARETSFAAAYDAARRDRTRQDMRSGSADADLLPDLAAMREKSRALCRDDAHAAAAVRVLLENVVGGGIHPQPAVRPKPTGLTQTQCDDFNEALADAWAHYATSAFDATEQSDYAEFCRTVYRGRVVDGEALLHRVIVNEPGREVASSWALVDPDRLVPPFTGRVDTRLGIERGGRGQPLRYWITPRHPDDYQFERTGTPNVPKPYARKNGEWWNLLHVFRKERAGQSRGVPLLAPSMPLFEHLHHYLDSEIIAARANANIALFIRRPLDTSDPDLNPVARDDGSGDLVYHEEIEPGTIEYLNEGEEIQSHTPNRPGTTFDPFVIRVLRAICAAVGLPYELVVKDFARMNYSSSRVALLEARRGFECEQGNLIATFCRPVWETFVREAIQKGIVPAYPRMLEGMRPFLAARWVRSAWGWVDPTKEVQAASLAIDGNLSTPQQEALRAGMSFREIIEARADAAVLVREVEEARGLPPGTLTAKSANGSSSPAPAPAPPEDQADQADGEDTADQADQAEDSDAGDGVDQPTEDQTNEAIR